jgi:molybdopterin-guanine dinucleotide biosynthesis protein A
MQAAGFVLAGGASSRMGRNKAFLMLSGRTLIEIVTSAVREAVGNVTIVGPPEVYQHLGIPVIPDRTAHAGPLAGIETALSHTTAAGNLPDWNLIVACDMPNVTPTVLRRILAEAQAHPDAACILPCSCVTGFSLTEPLCAAYHKRILPVISQALAEGIRKVTDALPKESIHYLPMTNDPAFQNINTPDEWSRVSGRP